MSSRGNFWSGGCGASHGAAIAASSAAARERRCGARRSAERRGHSADARIHERERQVGKERRRGEEHRARRRAAGDQVDVARPQRLEHQAAEAGPGGDDFDGERPAQHGAGDDAVHRRHRRAATP